MNLIVQVAPGEVLHTEVMWPEPSLLLSDEWCVLTKFPVGSSSVEDEVPPFELLLSPGSVSLLPAGPEDVLPVESEGFVSPFVS
jgi:hypothetical protein